MWTLPGSYTVPGNCAVAARLWLFKGGCTSATCRRIITGRACLCLVTGVAAEAGGGCRKGGGKAQGREVWGKCSRVDLSSMAWPHAPPRPTPLLSNLPTSVLHRNSHLLFSLIMPPVDAVPSDPLVKLQTDKAGFGDGQAEARGQRTEKHLGGVGCTSLNSEPAPALLPDRPLGECGPL